MFALLPTFICRKSFSFTWNLSDCHKRFVIFTRIQRHLVATQVIHSSFFVFGFPKGMPWAYDKHFRWWYKNCIFYQHDTKYGTLKIKAPRQRVNKMHNILFIDVSFQLCRLLDRGQANSRSFISRRYRNVVLIYELLYKHIVSRLDYCQNTF